MKKRVISLVLVFCMLLSLFPTTALAAPTKIETTAELTNPFGDVKETDWFYDAVQYARVNGFFSGTGANEFAPGGTMTRGMFVTVLGRMAGVDAENYKGQSAFSDVAAGQYYAPYVAWAAKHEITSGIGDGTFAPDAMINRAQMAAFFVRYFEAFDVDYETGANISTTPADMASIPAYAQEAVLKLWKQGLLNGDGKNFDPSGQASRAQAATLCMRTDEAVDTWYKEPGVLSDRVSIDPKTGAIKPATGNSNVNSGYYESDSSSGSSTTQYYEVKFAKADGSVDVPLPATATYPAGTLISTLPAPDKMGTIFLGWSYEDGTGVETGDTVDRNMTLYANVAAGEEVTSLETPNYVTRTDVAAGTYTFDIIGAADIDTAYVFTNITGGNTHVVCNVQGTKVSATLEAGQTYQVELTDAAAQFKLNGEIQPESIRYLNILTAKQTVTNAELDKGVKQIPFTAVSGLSDDVFNGLYEIDEDGVAAQNESSGTFTYVGNETLQAGDTVAITSGNVDLTDVTSTEGDVAYVKITGVNGQTYSYIMADLDDVLFIPDVLPIESDWDIDNIDGQITVSAGNMAAVMSFMEADGLDEGDFLGFLESGDEYDTADSVASYGEITGVTVVGDNYVITYTAATETQVEGALDVYYTQDKKIELTEEEKNKIENELKNDVEASGYIEEAALYLASVMLESNNLEEIPDMDMVSYNMRTMSASDATYGNGSVTRAGNGNTVTVKFDVKNVRVNVGTDATLEHLVGKGFDVSVKIPFIVTIKGSNGNKLQINVTAELEEEVLLKQNISTKRHKIGFLRYDYSLNASFEVGNYTGIEFTAKVHTVDGDNVSLAPKLEKILKKMMDQQSSGSSADDGTMDSLAETYKEIMDKANDAWIDILNVKLFETNGSAFLHIFCWQIKGSFVVSANMYVSMGMNFNYTTQKQYNFSVRVKEETATNQVIDIIEPQYNFDFYVVGTLGIRAGLRLEMYVGLISLKLDKVGIMAEVGAYTRLWGYFFYHLEWTQSQGKNSNSAGAMLIEIGMYLDVNFVAQLFNSNKLTWAPSLYSNEWPLWSAGERENIFAFIETEDNDYTLLSAKTLALPGSTYTMHYMDLKNGRLGAINKDDDTESNFIITFSNPAFSYSAANNTVTVTPDNGSLAEETDMLIAWKRAPLAFSSTPIQKVIHISWSDPEGMRYISFDSNGGSAVNQIAAGSGNRDIIWPAAPEKLGYEFVGWYTDSACTTAYAGSTTEMPDFPEGTKGITLYAKWTPADVTYTVEHYLQQLNGTYELEYPEEIFGKTESLTQAVADTNVGFTAKPFAQQTIAADGSTVVKVYYDRNSYTVEFAPNYGSEENLTRTARYGEDMVVPVMGRDGYTFKGWTTTEADSGEYITEFDTVSRNVIYYAQWIGNENTVIFNSQSGSDVASATVRTGDKVSEPAAPTKAGHTFAGWYTDETCHNAWDFANDAVAGTMTLYAKWDVNYYTVSWEANGGNVLTGDYTNGSVAYGTEITAPVEPTKDADVQYTYTFSGWNTKADGSGTAWKQGDAVAGNVTYYAQWSDSTNKYTVSWDANGGNALTGSYTNGAVAYGTAITAPDTPTKAADDQYTYAFKGWTTTEADTEEYVTDFGTVTGDVTYYAQWGDSTNQYTVSWNTNGGSGLTGEYTNGEVDYGTAITAPGAPTRDADVQYTYTFSSWNTKADGSGTTFKAGDTVKGSVTYYAQWSKTINKYTVNWDANEGNALTGSYTNGEVDYGTAITAPDTPTKAATDQYSYTFDGWYTAAEGGTKVTDFGTVTGDVTYYAQFRASVNEYTITWQGEEALKQTLAYGTAITAPEPPTKASSVSTDYTFAGWYTAAESGDEVTEFGTVTGAATYYAHWNETARKYTVTFETNGGSAIAAKQVAYNTCINYVTTSKPNSDGKYYDFEGWYADEALTQSWNIYSDKVLGDMTIYAKWTENEFTNYGIWVGDTEITTTNLTVFDGDINNCAIFLPKSNKLILNGTLAYEIEDGGAITIDNDNLDQLTIEVVGACKVINSYIPTEGKSSYGILVKSDTKLNIVGWTTEDVRPSLTVRGGSNLTVKGEGKSPAASSVAMGICTPSEVTVNVDSYNITFSAGYGATTIGVQCDTIEVQKGWVLVQAEDVYTNKPDADLWYENAGNLYALIAKTVKVYGATGVSGLKLLAPDRAIYPEDDKIEFYGDDNLKVRCSTGHNPGASVIYEMVNFNPVNIDVYRYIYILNTSEID